MATVESAIISSPTEGFVFDRSIYKKFTARGIIIFSSLSSSEIDERVDVRIYIDDLPDYFDNRYFYAKKVNDVGIRFDSTKLDSLTDGKHTIRLQFYSSAGYANFEAWTDPVTIYIKTSDVKPDQIQTITKTSYIGVNNKARRIKKMYIGVNGKARPVSKAYIGINNKARLWYDEEKVFRSKVYGVYWDGTSTTKWTRTGDAAFFTDPVPYVIGSSNYGSPFDKIYPWSDIKRVTDPEAGELVAIPKFYFRWTQSGNVLKLQITGRPSEGFFTSPAHMDRGDGKGERSIVYVSRYPVSLNGDLNRRGSFSGGTPKNDTISDARDILRKLGSDIYAFDYAMLCTIQMLYLVEFANWNSQKVIGYGGSLKSNITGGTDTMPYHTGVMHNDREVYGYDIQYRYIEGLWTNRYWIDGIKNVDSTLYIRTNPNEYSNTNGGYTTNILTSSGFIKYMKVAGLPGLEWVLLPSSTGGSKDTYVSDYTFTSSGSYHYIYTGSSSNNAWTGLFYMDNSADGTTRSYRLQKLP